MSAARGASRYAAVVALATLTAVLLVRTATVRSRQVHVSGAPLAAPDLDAAQLAARLSRAVQFATVSAPPDDGAGAVDRAPFRGLVAFLRATYPLVHARLALQELVSPLSGAISLLYHWPAPLGQAERGAAGALRPLVLLSHLDVVPVEAASERLWSVPPFEGRVLGDFIWGRGTMDDKCGVLGILEALERLLAEHDRGHFRPRRDLYVGFGADEEVGGHQGAALIAAALRARGVRAEALLDEGQPIVSGLVRGLRVPVALIGTSEKGYVDVELSVAAPAGHSSMPPPSTAIGILAKAVAALEAAPMPCRLSGGAREMFEFLAPEMRLGFRLLMANLWLFAPPLTWLLAREQATRALLQSTTAVTVVQGGTKSNVLPSAARAVVNHRVHPGDSVAAVLAHDRAAIADDRVQLRVLDSLEPAPVSATSAPSFAVLQRSIAEVFPEAVVAPSLMTGNTDTRHFWELADAIYRFCPLRLGPADVARYHGVDERIGVQNLAEVVSFYYRLLRNFNAPPEAPGQHNQP